MKNPTKLTSKKIMAILICSLVLFCLVLSVSAQSTVVKAEASASQPRIGDTIAVDVKISNVQNLFGVDVTLNWDKSVLEVISATSLLGVESHPEGVLHETSSYPIEIVDNTATQSLGQYHLMATSTGSASSFSGSGTIATVTFNVTNTGPTGLFLETELSDYPQPGQSSNLIAHTDTVDTVTAVIPEFPNLIAIATLIVIATTTIGVSSKIMKKRKSLSIKKTHMS